MSKRGVIMLELMLAVTVFIMGILSLSAVMFQQMRVTRATYRKQLVMGILDREMLKLQAGDHNSFKPGPVSEYTTAGLPGGTVTLEVTDHGSVSNLRELKLVWNADPGLKLPSLSLTGLIYTGGPFHE